MKSVLITGGAGFIGRNLIRRLNEKGGWEIAVYDNFTVGARDGLEEQGVRVIEGDVRDAEGMDRAAQGIDAIVHFAAHTNVINSIADPVNDATINVYGVLHALDALRKNGKENTRFVFASSGAPLGDQPPPANENVVPRPLSPYGASKMAGEGYCSAFHGSYGIETVALRFSNCYGPLSGHKSSVVAKFIKEILDGKDLTIFGDGMQTRDFIYVADLCEAVRLGLETPGIGGKVFQVATGVESTVKDVAEKLAAVSGRNVKVNYEGFRKGEIKRNYSDITLARKVLGFDPKHSLDEGLKLTWEWFEKQ